MVILGLFAALHSQTTLDSNQVRLKSGNTTTFATAASDLHGAAAAATACADGSGNVTTVGCSAGGGTGGASKIPFDSCTADQTIHPGNAYWRSVSYTASAGIASVDMGSWEYSILDVANPANHAIGIVVCKLEIPSNASGTLHVFLDLASNDTTAGHTATYQVCYGFSSSQNVNNRSYTCTASQTYTSTATAYANTRLDFTTASGTIGEYFIANIVGTSVTNGAAVRMVAKVKVF